MLVKLSGALTIFLGVLTLSSCGGSKDADKALYLCFGSTDGTEATMVTLQRVSNQFGYHFQEHGAESKADLQTIDANPAVIPDGRPIQAEIARDDGKILLIASNFGSKAGDIRLSFFFYGNERENSPFYRTMMSEVKRLPNVHLYLSGAEVGFNPCGELR